MIPVNWGVEKWKGVLRMKILGEVLMGGRELAHRTHFETPSCPYLQLWDQTCSYHKFLLPCLQAAVFTIPASSIPSNAATPSFVPFFFSALKISFSAYSMNSCLKNQASTHRNIMFSRKPVCVLLCHFIFLSTFISPSLFCNDVSVPTIANAGWSYSCRSGDVGALTSRVLRWPF